MAHADPAAYDWLFEGDLAHVGAAACVSVAVGATREQVAEAFGLDLDAPAGADAVAARGQELVGLVEVDDGVVAVETSGSAGATVEVLGAVSGTGRAAGTSWSEDDLVRFGCARGGRVLYDGEFVYDGTDGLPADLVPLVELVADDLLDDLSDDDPQDDPPIDIAVGMALVETYTGVQVTPELVRRALAQRYPRTADPDAD